MMKNRILFFVLVVLSSVSFAFAQNGPTTLFRVEKVTLYFPDGRTDTRIYSPDNATKGMRWYINNGGCIIMEDPDTFEIFCGTYRIFRERTK